MREKHIAWLGYMLTLGVIISIYFACVLAAKEHRGANQQQQVEPVQRLEIATQVACAMINNLNHNGRKPSIEDIVDSATKIADRLIFVTSQPPEAVE